MKKVYVAPALVLVATEVEQGFCGASHHNNDPNGLVGPGGDYGGEYPNGGQDEPGFGGYVDDDGPGSTAKEFNLWGDFDW